MHRIVLFIVVLSLGKPYSPHKQIIVQGCNGLLKVGVTADAKVFGAPRSQKKIGLTCHLCATRKAFLLGELFLPEMFGHFVCGHFAMPNTEYPVKYLSGNRMSYRISCLIPDVRPQICGRLNTEFFIRSDIILAYNIGLL